MRTTSILIIGLAVVALLAGILMPKASRRKKHDDNHYSSADYPADELTEQ